MPYEVWVTAPTVELMLQVEQFVGTKSEGGVAGGKNGYGWPFHVPTEEAGNDLIKRIYEAFPQTTAWGAHVVNAEIEEV